MTRYVALGAALALLLAACNGGDDEQAIEPIPPPDTAEDDDPDEPDDPEPELEEEPEPDPEPDPEPEPNGVDVTVIPDEITPEYVEAVLFELETLFAESFAEFGEAGEVTPRAADVLDAAFSDEQAVARISALAQREDGDRFLGVDDIEPRGHSVVELLDTADGCVYAETLIDPSGLTGQAETEITAFVLLRPPDNIRTQNLNPTPWVFWSIAGGDPEDSRERQPCSG
ncbi:MAG: hypothetical protein JJT89_01410 [Nitriliruptoraceae bacterium]|nr:hypothetical protein [Nitriliruptoraceae bacterium]